MSREDQDEFIEALINKDWEYEPIDPPKEVKCCICNEVLIDPITHALCGNMFCRKCINKVTNCPFCKMEIKESDLVPVPLLIKNRIAELKVKCKQCNREMTK